MAPIPLHLRGRVAASLTVMVWAGLIGLTGCSAGGDSGSASCAAIIVFEGHKYLQMNGVPFTAGRQIGTAGLHDCNSSDALATQPNSDREILEVNGLSVDLVIAAEFKSQVWLFGRQGDSGRLLPEVEKLITSTSAVSPSAS